MNRSKRPAEADRPVSKEWITARDRLLARNLQIDEKGCMRAGDLFPLLEDKQFQDDIEVYLKPSPFERDLFQLFSDCSELIYQVQMHENSHNGLFNAGNEWSDYCVRGFRAKRINDLAYMRRKLQDVISHLEDIKENEH